MNGVMEFTLKMALQSEIAVNDPASLLSYEEE